MKIALLSLLLLVPRLVAAEQAAASEAVQVECRGVIESFSKDGFQALVTDGSCERFDTTTVVIKSPEEFSGVRHQLLSRTSTGKSAFGEIGDWVSFSAYRSTLEFEKHPERSRIDAKKIFAELEKSEKKPAQPSKTIASLPLHEAPVAVPPSVGPQQVATYLAGYEAGWLATLRLFAEDIGHKSTFREYVATGDPNYLDGWFAAKDEAEAMIHRLVASSGTDRARAVLAAAVKIRQEAGQTSAPAHGTGP